MFTGGRRTDRGDGREIRRQYIKRIRHVVGDCRRVRFLNVLFRLQDQCSVCRRRVAGNGLDIYVQLYQNQKTAKLEYDTKSVTTVKNYLTYLQHVPESSAKV